MRELKGDFANLSPLSSINIILGRNGSGKSRFLRDIENTIHKDNENFYVRYISPQRGGTFKRDGIILTNISMNPNFLRENRSTNFSNNFKAASAMLFREAELMYLRNLASIREIREDIDRNFYVDRLQKVNNLFNNIELVMGNEDFEFRSTVDGNIIDANEISSGESEAMALASEIIYFFDTVDSNKFNVLLIDEPDVHLHPDLQSRIGTLIIDMLKESKIEADKIAVCIATHSTSLVSALSSYSEYVSIGTKQFGKNNVKLTRASEKIATVAPFFGHPLSLSLNNDAPLIIEGEDDQRVWQQAYRSSQGRIKVFPILSRGVSNQGIIEKFVSEILPTIYDEPVAFSIRDGDNAIGEALEHWGPLKRYRLNCYSIENALLTDQCLSLMKSDWGKFVASAKNWMSENPKNEQYSLIEELTTSSNRLRNRKIKEIRNIICSITECSSQWESVVGKAIAKIKESDIEQSNMLIDYLGKEIVSTIIFR